MKDNKNAYKTNLTPLVISLLIMAGLLVCVCAICTAFIYQLLRVKIS